MSDSKKIIAHDIKGKEYEITPDQLTFRPAIYAIIIKGDKVLLSKQWDGYDFPGGGVKLGETLGQALTREVKEETGYDTKIDKLIHCQSNFFRKIFKEEFIHSILLYYTAEVIGGEASKDFLTGNEVEYVDLPEWIEIDKIKDIKFYNDVDSVKLIHDANNH